MLTLLHLRRNNLFLIQQTQEAEQAYEEKSHEFIKIKKKYENELRVLEGNLAEKKDKISKITGDMDKDDWDWDIGDYSGKLGLGSKIKKVASNTGKAWGKYDFENDEKNFVKKIRQKVREVYRSISAEEGKHVESNNSTLYLLGEIEKKWDELIKEELTWSEKEPVKFHEEYKQIQKDIKQENMKQNKLKQELESERKRKAEDKSKKSMFDTYKPLMKRSKPKAIKKKVENDNKLSKDDLDKLYFLGFY